MEYNYENSYWSGNGRFQDLYDRLHELIPGRGSVKGSKNAKLERLRKMANAYYDLFNNGGMNRQHAISSYFKIYRDDMIRACGPMKLNWICSKVDPVIEQAILEAAEEQGLVDIEVTSYD